MEYISEEVYQEINKYTISKDDLYISIAGTIGLVGRVPMELSGSNLTENAAKITLNSEKIDIDFLMYLFQTEMVQSQIKNLTHAVGVPKLALSRINTIKIPIPSEDIQKEEVNKIKEEIRIIEGNKKLISIYSKKIQSSIDMVWGNF